MKTVFAFAFLVMGITALNQPEEYPIETATRNLVERNIVKAIEAVSQGIKDAGLDPLHIETLEYSYGLPVPVLFNSAGSAKDINSSGASHIVIHRINYSHVTSRLTFDLELPHISFSVGAAESQTTVFGSTLKVEASGKFALRNIRIAGDVRVNVGLISGISIRSINLSFTLGAINSDITLVVQDKNHSDKINYFLNSTVVETIDTYGPEFNELLEIIVVNIVNN